MTTKTERSPDTCPNHPQDRIVITERNSDDTHSRTLIQYRCGAGCNTPLGWQYSQQEPSMFLHGQGECDDPRPLQALAVQKQHIAIQNYHQNTAAIAIIAALATSIPIGFALSAWTYYPSQMQNAISLTAFSAIAMTTIAAFSFIRCRRQPHHPNLPDTAGTKPTQQAS